MLRTEKTRSCTHRKSVDLKVYKTLYRFSNHYFEAFRAVKLIQQITANSQSLLFLYTLHFLELELKLEQLIKEATRRNIFQLQAAACIMFACGAHKIV